MLRHFFSLKWIHYRVPCQHRRHAANSRSCECALQHFVPWLSLDPVQQKIRFPAIWCDPMADSRARSRSRLLQRPRGILASNGRNDAEPKAVAPARAHLRRIQIPAILPEPSRHRLYGLQAFLAFLEQRMLLSKGRLLLWCTDIRGLSQARHRASACVPQQLDLLHPEFRDSDENALRLFRPARQVLRRAWRDYRTLAGAPLSSLFSGLLHMRYHRPRVAYKLRQVFL